MTETNLTALARLYAVVASTADGNIHKPFQAFFSTYVDTLVRGALSASSSAQVRGLIASMDTSDAALYDDATPEEMCSFWRVYEMERERLVDHTGERISALRDARGISQQELADAVGVSRNTVSRWELGDMTPRRRQLEAIASYFGVPPASME